jgi:uncharacterized protein
MTSALNGYREGLEAEELRLPQCDECGSTHWPPRDLCPACRSFDLSWRTASRRAVVVTWTVVHRAALPDFARVTPFAVAVLDLVDDGVRVMGRVDGPPDRLYVGASCSWQVVSGPDGSAVPLWHLEEESTR